MPSVFLHVTFLLLHNLTNKGSKLILLAYCSNCLAPGKIIEEH